MTPTFIHLVRHGNVHNPENVIYGRLPGFFLSHTGQTEARRLGKHLATKPIRAIYSSPLDRARETATYIAAHHDDVPVTYDDRLLETLFPYEGSKQSAFANWNFYADEIIENGGERMEDIAKRMTEMLGEIAQKHRGHHVVAVSHGDPIMITKEHYRNQGNVLLENIHGDTYVPTAHGFLLTFSPDGSTTVVEIEP